MFIHSPFMRGLEDENNIHMAAMQMSPRRVQNVVKKDADHTGCSAVETKSRSAMLVSGPGWRTQDKEVVFMFLIYMLFFTAMCH